MGGLGMCVCVCVGMSTHTILPPPTNNKHTPPHPPPPKKPTDLAQVRVQVLRLARRLPVQKRQGAHLHIHLQPPFPRPLVRGLRELRLF